MKKCSIAALLALTWLMIMPPPKMPPVKDKHGYYEVNLAMPITRWAVFATYRNEAACRGDLKDKPSYFKCVDNTSPAFRAAAVAEARRPRQRHTTAAPTVPPQAPPKN